VNTTLGASNVSFGMPDRLAIGAGVPADGQCGRPDQRDHGRQGRRSSWQGRPGACDLLLNRDEWGATLDRRAHRAAARGRRSELDWPGHGPSAEVAGSALPARGRSYLRTETGPRSESPGRGSMSSTRASWNGGSRSTRPAAGHGHLQEMARSGLRTGRCRRRAWTRGRSRPTKLRAGWAAAGPAGPMPPCDLRVRGLPPDRQRGPRAATVRASGDR